MEKQNVMVYEERKPMRSGVTRLTGVITLIAAVFGLLISMYGIYALWAAKPAITQGVSDMMSLATRTANATDAMLITVQTSLENASRDLLLMRNILNDTSETIGQSTTTVDETATLMGENMPQIIRNTQGALTGMQKTAVLIDDMMGAIGSIPFAGSMFSNKYAPDVPLAQTIVQVSSSLDPLPDSFKKVQGDLKTASASMATIKAEMEALSKQVADIEKSVQDAKKEVTDYQLILADTRDQLQKWEKGIPVVVDTVYLALTAFLIWLGVSQLAALLKGAELLNRKM